MLKILFWLFVAVDLVVLVIFGLLGLAAARPSHTNPFAAILIPFVLPGAILCGAVWLFLHSHTTAGRLLALGVAALPFLVVVISQGASLLTLSAHRDGLSETRPHAHQLFRTLLHGLRADFPHDSDLARSQRGE